MRPLPTAVARGKEPGREYGSTADIAQLEWKRSLGATFLAVPGERRWWLRRHPDFALHLLGLRGGRRYERWRGYALAYAPESWVRD